MSRKELYKYRGESLHKYCMDNSLGYASIRERINRELGNSDKKLEDIIEWAIEEQRRYQSIKSKRDFLNGQEIEECSLVQIADRLDLNYRALYEIKCFGYDKVRAAKMLMFLSDKTAKDGKKSMSVKKLNEVNELLKMTEPQKVNDPLLSICLVNLGYNEYFKEFYESRKIYCTKLINKSLVKYGLEDSYFEDCYQELMFKQWEIMSNCYSGHIEQLTKYYNRCLDGHLKKILNDKKREKEVIHLDSYMNDNQSYYDVISNDHRI